MGVRGTQSHLLGLQVCPETRWVSAGLRRTLLVCRPVPRPVGWGGAILSGLVRGNSGVRGAHRCYRASHDPLRSIKGDVRGGSSEDKTPGTLPEGPEHPRDLRVCSGQCPWLPSTSKQAWPGRTRVSAGPSGPLQVIVQLLRVAQRLYPWGSDPWPRVPVFGLLHSSRRSAVSASPLSFIPAPQGGEAVVTPGNRRRARTKTLPCSPSPQAGLPSIRFLVP